MRVVERPINLNTTVNRKMLEILILTLQGVDLLTMFVAQGIELVVSGRISLFCQGGRERRRVMMLTSSLGKPQVEQDQEEE